MKSEKIRNHYSDINKQIGELSYRYENLNAKKRANENIIERNETFARATKAILQENIIRVYVIFDKRSRLRPIICFGSPSR